MITPFCRGLPGREACESCAGKLGPGQQPLREDSMHYPWPFEPCPHYCAREQGENEQQVEVCDA